MTSESEFSDRWRSEEPIYAAWGRFVGMTLSDAIQGRVAPTKLDLFLKLPVISAPQGAELNVTKGLLSRQRLSQSLRGH